MLYAISMEENKQIAIEFGRTLDRDQFELTKKLLSADCKYIIGEEVLIGPAEICDSYEKNMIEGRKKLDKLEWGESKVEVVDMNEFILHFTDFLTHKYQKHVHRCKQKLTFNNNGLICSIKHIDNPEETKKLNEYYKTVGLYE